MTGLTMVKLSIKVAVKIYYKTGRKGNTFLRSWQPATRRPGFFDSLSAALLGSTLQTNFRIH
jgi:hypothetical protein